jgi:hypothetical protein
MLERRIAMTSKLLTITAMVVALSACAAPASSPQLSGSTVRPSDHCGYDDGNSFNTPNAMKLPKNAFCSPG